MLCTDSKVVHDGKQELEKVDYQKYTDTTIDTKIMNRNLPKNLLIERRELMKSIAKAYLSRDFKKAKTIKILLQRISKNGVLLQHLKNKVSKSGATFLNLH